MGFTSRPINATDGNQVGILDANAENLNEREIYDKINHLKPETNLFRCIWAEC